MLLWDTGSTTILGKEMLTFVQTTQVKNYTQKEFTAQTAV